MPYVSQGTVIENVALNKHTYRMMLSQADMAHCAKPGQFLQVKTSAQGRVLLNKPISIARVQEDQLEILYQVVGPGTKALSQRQAKEKILLVGPLGNGFPLGQKEKVLLVGGGIGLAPLCFLLEELKKKENQVHVIAGFNRKEDMFYQEFFNAHADQFVVTTMDGSCGLRGHACSPFEDAVEFSSFDRVYACGPQAMLKSLQKRSLLDDVPTYLSLESYMACGFGACLGCVQKIAKKDGTFDHDRVCLEGPVFLAEEVVYDE